MKNVIAAGLLALALVGCENMGQYSDDMQARLTAAIVKTCQFVPTPGTVSSLLSAWDVGAGAAAGVLEQIAANVCASVTAKSGATGWVVYGPDGEEIEVEGVFVQ
jgi:hypothetical protein